MNADFWSAFSDLAGRLGGNDAILAPGRETLTFAGLKDRIAAAKEDLNRLGIGRGDRLAIALPNGPEMAVCLPGTMACTIAAPLNPSCTRDEHRQYLNGMKLLNPVRTRVEDRYLAGTVTLEDANGLGALHELRGYLEANTVITIAANGSEGVSFGMPFLGGTLKLSLGAPMLAALHGAPRLPPFTAADGAGGFEVTIGPPVEARAHGYAGETARELARGYAKILEAHLRRHPAEWRGWFMRHTWCPRGSR